MSVCIFRFFFPHQINFIVAIFSTKRETEKKRMKEGADTTSHETVIASTELNKKKTE